jgi:hypothetical protein
MTSSPVHHLWTLYEPTLKTQGKQPQAVIYTNNTQLTPAQISQIDLPFTDAVAISIQTNCEGTKKNILIGNIYNPCGASIIQGVRNSLVMHLRQKEYDMILLTGDFNCHHPRWNPRHYLAHDEVGDELIEAVADLKLELLLPPRTVTFPQAKTAIDLVWGDANAALGLQKCHIAPGKDFGSDHLPIETLISIARDVKKEITSLYNYQKNKLGGIHIQATQRPPFTYLRAKHRNEGGSGDSHPRAYNTDYKGGARKHAKKKTISTLQKVVEL